MFNHEPNGYQCPYCILASGNETDLNKQSDIVFQDDEVIAYVSPKWWPNNPGNVIVIPRQHVENIYDISDELFQAINATAKKVALAMKQAYQCHGISFRQHNEPAGGQDIWHFHAHILPRWKGDDLYINHKNARFVSEEERKPYVEKLRNIFQSSLA